MEKKKQFIGKNVVWDSSLSAISFLLSVILATYEDFFGIPGIVLKTLFVILGLFFTGKSIVDIIRKRIINRELQPGQKIVEQELAKEFQTSRAPIREALRELENEGLVEYVRNAGCSVKEITFEESFEIYLMRANYEIMAVRLLGGKIPEETLQEMEKILERMKNLDVDEYDQLFSYDNKFHSCLIRMTGMKSLYKAWKSLNYGNIVTGYNLASDKKAVITRQYPIHKELLEACKSRKKEEICKVLSDHYMGTIHRLLKEQGMTEADTKFSLDFLIS